MTGGPGHRAHVAHSSLKLFISVAMRTFGAYASILVSRCPFLSPPLTLIIPTHTSHSPASPIIPTLTQIPGGGSSAAPEVTSCKVTALESALTKRQQGVYGVR